MTEPLILNASQPITATNDLESFTPKKADVGPMFKFACGSPKRMMLSMSTLFILGASLILPIVTLAIVPAVVQAFVGDTTIRLVHAKISEPTADSMHLLATLEIGNSGPISASLHSFSATLAYDGQDFGTLPFPSVVLQGGGNTLVQINREREGLELGLSVPPAHRGKKMLRAAARGMARH